MIKPSAHRKIVPEQTTGPGDQRQPEIHTGMGDNLTGEPKTTDPASMIPLVSRDLGDNGCKDTTSLLINEIFP